MGQYIDELHKINQSINYNKKRSELIREAKSKCFTYFWDVFKKTLKENNGNITIEDIYNDYRNPFNFDKVTIEIKEELGLDFSKFRREHNEIYMSQLNAVYKQFKELEETQRKQDEINQQEIIKNKIFAEKYTEFNQWCEKERINPFQVVNIVCKLKYCNNEEELKNAWNSHDVDFFRREIDFIQSYKNSLPSWMLTENEQKELFENELKAKQLAKNIIENAPKFEKEKPKSLFWSCINTYINTILVIIFICICLIFLCNI